MPVVKTIENQTETGDLKVINKKQFEYIRDNWFIQPERIEEMLGKSTDGDLKTTLHRRFNLIKSEWPIQPYRIYLMYSQTTPYTYNYVQRILAEKRRA